MRSVSGEPISEISKLVAAQLRKLRVKLTLGGEPSYVPIEPNGAEWNVTALGPTKLRYAEALADELIKTVLPHAVAFYAPGKTYPGEVNPRWALHILWNRDDSRVLPRPRTKTPPSISERQRLLTRALKVRGKWMRARDPEDRENEVWVLPLDHDGRKWRSEKWELPKKFELIGGDAPAGLRLPLNLLPDTSAKRALTIEQKGEKLYVFFPPLLQRPFTELLRLFNDVQNVRMGAYLPEDETGHWGKLSLTPDPGVLEVNLPPCADAAEYARWLRDLERCTAAVGLRSCKPRGVDETFGTGGGNHILFGAPTLDANAFFTHPRWIPTILRYWQRHPSLSYLFTGDYVGPSSQAPRPDESARPLYDLEMAYQFLEKLPTGRDQRHLISETLRHLHTDGSGNTHRSEVSFDKFWNVSWPGGCRGLIEFRAVESMPHAEWMSAVATLWQSLATMLFPTKAKGALVEHGHRLHDYFFLPSLLWGDFEHVLRDLKKSGFAFDASVFRQIWEWRFPLMLAFENDGAQLFVRKALEGWPLLCETPLEGGSTSRFVDTSMERLEFLATKNFAAKYRIFVQGRELPLLPFAESRFGAGLRYRRTALHPSLHPGIAPHMPLRLEIAHGDRVWNYRLEPERRKFQPDSGRPIRRRAAACKKLNPDLLTYDLRLA
ncbi:MAG: transglutaminase family protein [Verrucomicrobiota bacterium]|nr:transglutaminase family protein [Verrucomicrobiota bacterium]